MDGSSSGKASHHRPDVDGQNLFTSESDTINDLFDGFVGAGIGGALLATWALTRYPTRRIPRSIADASRPPSPAPGLPAERGSLAG